MPKAKKILSFLLCFFFIFEQSGFAQVAGSLGIPTAISGLSNILIKDKFRPLHLRSLSYEAPSNKFNLLLDRGDEFKGLSPKGTDPKLENVTKDLLNYFFIGLTLPNSSFWVNLRPDAEDNIIDSELAKTDVGKILLEADLQLKKDTAKYTSPETPEGKEYWDKLYQKAQEIFGDDNITIPTLIRPWIVPDEIILRETSNNAYIYKATLKVMLEQDYLKGSALYSFEDPRLKALNEYSSQLIRELIIPKLTREVNASKRYAALRQVYYSLILAQWFKEKFEGLTPQTKGLSPQGTDPEVNKTVPDLIDSRNLTGLTSKTIWSKSTYFNAYQKSVKAGEYNIQQSVYSPYGQTIRTYFSGGILLKTLMSLPGMTKIQGNPVRTLSNQVIGVSFTGNPAEGDIEVREVPPAPKPAGGSPRDTSQGVSFAKQPGGSGAGDVNLGNEDLSPAVKALIADANSRTVLQDRFGSTEINFHILNPKRHQKVLFEVDGFWKSAMRVQRKDANSIDVYVAEEAFKWLININNNDGRRALVEHEVLDTSSGAHRMSWQQVKEHNYAGMLKFLEFVIDNMDVADVLVLIKEYENDLSGKGEGRIASREWGQFEKELYTYCVKRVSEKIPTDLAALVEVFGNKDMIYGLFGSEKMLAEQQLEDMLKSVAKMTGKSAEKIGVDEAMALLKVKITEVSEAPGSGDTHVKIMEGIVPITGSYIHYAVDAIPKLEEAIKRIRLLRSRVKQGKDAIKLNSDIIEGLAKTWDVDRFVVEARMASALKIFEQFKAIKAENDKRFNEFEAKLRAEAGEEEANSILAQLYKQTHQAWLEKEKEDRGKGLVLYTKELHEFLLQGLKSGTIVIEGVSPELFGNPKKKFKLTNPDSIYKEVDDVKFIRFENEQAKAEFWKLIGRNEGTDIFINTVGGNWEELTRDAEADRHKYLSGLQRDSVSAIIKALDDTKLLEQLAKGSDEEKQQAIVEILRRINAGWRLNNPWNGFTDRLIHKPFDLEENGGIGIADIMKDFVVLEAILGVLYANRDKVPLSAEAKEAIASAYQNGLEGVLEGLGDSSSMREAVRINVQKRPKQHTVGEVAAKIQAGLAAQKFVSAEQAQTAWREVAKKEMLALGVQEEVAAFYLEPLAQLLTVTKQGLKEEEELGRILKDVARMAGKSAEKIGADEAIALLKAKITEVSRAPGSGEAHVKIMQSIVPITGGNYVHYAVDAIPRLEEAIKRIEDLQAALGKRTDDAYHLHLAQASDTTQRLSIIKMNTLPKTLDDLMLLFAEQSSIDATITYDIIDGLAKAWDVDLWEVVARITKALRAYERLKAIKVENDKRFDGFEAQLKTEAGEDAARDILAQLYKQTHQSWLAQEKIARGDKFVLMTRTLYNFLLKGLKEGKLAINGVESADQFDISMSPKQKIKIENAKTRFSDASVEKEFWRLIGKNPGDGFFINMVGGEWDSLVGWDAKRDKYLSSLQRDSVSAIVKALDDMKLLEQLARRSDEEKQQAIVEILRRINAGWRLNNPWNGFTDRLIHKPFDLEENGGIGIADIMKDFVVLKAILGVLYANRDKVPLSTEAKEAIASAYQNGLEGILEGLGKEDFMKEVVRKSAENAPGNRRISFARIPGPSSDSNELETAEEAPPSVPAEGTLVQGASSSNLPQGSGTPAQGQWAEKIEAAEEMTLIAAKILDAIKVEDFNYYAVKSMITANLGKYGAGFIDVIVPMLEELKEKETDTKKKAEIYNLILVARTHLFGGLPETPSIEKLVAAIFNTSDLLKNLNPMDSKFERRAELLNLFEKIIDLIDKSISDEAIERRLQDMRRVLNSQYGKSDFPSEISKKMFYVHEKCEILFIRFFNQEEGRRMFDDLYRKVFDVSQVPYGDRTFELAHELATRIEVILAWRHLLLSDEVEKDFKDKLTYNLLNFSYPARLSALDSRMDDERGSIDSKARHIKEFREQAGVGLSLGDVFTALDYFYRLKIYPLVNSQGSYNYFKLWAYFIFNHNRITHELEYKFTQDYEEKRTELRRLQKEWEAEGMKLFSSVGDRIRQLDRQIDEHPAGHINRIALGIYKIGMARFP